jgi:hypothetical protein
MRSVRRRIKVRQIELGNKTAQRSFSVSRRDLGDFDITRDDTNLDLRARHSPL